MHTNVVFDFGAVLFGWRPDLLLAEQFPHRAGTPQAAKALAQDIFHHADWQSFDCGGLALEQVAERTAQRTALPLPELTTFMAGIGDRLAPTCGSTSYPTCRHRLPAHWSAATTS